MPKKSCVRAPLPLRITSVSSCLKEGPRAMTTHSNIKNIPSLQNRVALVTGGNSGVGYQTALALARAGAHTLIAARNAEKCARAVEAIRCAFPHARVETLALDLSDLARVRRNISCAVSNTRHSRQQCGGDGDSVSPHRQRF